MTAASFDASLHALGLGEWSPPGFFDEVSGVWNVSSEHSVSYPDSGLGVLAQSESASFWFRHRNKVVADVADRWASERAMLEVGSGSGAVAAHLQAHGWKIGCVEPQPSGAEAAARRGVALSFLGDLGSLKLPPSSVPTLGMFDVIEHIAEPGDLLAECRRVLRPDGCLVVTVPAYQWLWSDFDVWSGHHRRYSSATLMAEMAGAGFRAEYQSYFFAPLVPPAAFKRLVSRSLSADVAGHELEKSVAGDLVLPRSLDRLAALILRLERLVLRRVAIPFGTSIVGVFRAD